MTRMDTIQRHDTGPAVEDVQPRLARLGFLPEDGIDGVYGDAKMCIRDKLCKVRVVGALRSRQLWGGGR